MENQSISDQEQINELIDDDDHASDDSGDEEESRVESSRIQGKRK